MNYVLSDIHGNEKRFAAILKQIRLQPSDTLYVLGDVIDRHPGGVRILRKIMAMPNAKMLLGNHEYMMLRALGEPVDDNFDDGRAREHWYRNGGLVTHMHWKCIRKTLRREILDYLHSLPLRYDIEVNGQKYLLAHASVAEEFDGNPPYLNPIHYAVWKRLEEGQWQGAQTLIFGHTPTRHYRDIAPMQVWFGENCIGIDCGCGYPEEGPNSEYGRLACLRLEDGRVFYSE